MSGKLVLNLLIGLLGDLSLLAEVSKLRPEMLSEGAAGHAGPLLSVLTTELIINAFLLIEEFLHLLDHLKVVLANSTNALDHSADVTVTALFLEIFDLIPQRLRDFGSGARCVKSLRQAELLQELLLLSLCLLLGLELSVDDLLHLGLQLDLHDAHLRRDYVSQLLLNGKLPLQGIKYWLHLDEVLCVGSRDLIHGDLLLKIDCLVLFDGFLSHFLDIGILGVKVVLVV